MFSISIPAYRREEDQRIRSCGDGTKGLHVFFPANSGRVQPRHVPPPYFKKRAKPREWFLPDSWYHCPPEILLSAGTKISEIEFTQCRTLFPVKPSPRKTWPKCAPQLAQSISVRSPSGSGILFTTPGISSSKLGHPQLALNLSFERYSATLHRLQT